ncbi:DNA-directed RNA polymerase subunit [Quillaja saponaria]|uniref:DNA-directed RNA polymerase subunit n=1 Tax=Quillaja saponaria TaxID=32244 RepID=A0AAD7M006_QUISA|nr:DNA-directed RNA polymerase subunit [Quillaja saponaria]KAJ7966617.1 DNA-directed RNA polymerase subunit [Quillaja saponaria]
MNSLPIAPPHVYLRSNPIHFHLSAVILSSTFCRTTSSFQSRLCALKAVPDGSSIGSQEAYGSDFLRKPVVSKGKDVGGVLQEEEDSEGRRDYEEDSEDERWVDWEDQILEDTVPLVGFVRMILHSRKYGSGDRLNPEHERTILEKLLPFHPEFEKKIGCGIDYITVGYHPNFESSRCLFIVRKDGELVDFSYWKCIKGLIRKNYPLYADSFILRHFRRRRRNV